MKKILIISALIIGISSPAFAFCPPSLAGKDLNAYIECVERENQQQQMRRMQQQQIENQQRMMQQQQQMIEMQRQQQQQQQQVNPLQWTQPQPFQRTW